MRRIKRMLHTQFKSSSKAITGIRRSHSYVGILFGLIVSLFWGTAAAQENGDWPCFHGKSRNSKSAETGFLKKWPETGPELLWTVTGLGEGYSSVSIARGYVFTAGKINKQTYVFAFDLNGKEIWRMPNGNSWETQMSWAKEFPGPRSTPAYDDGFVYHFGETGRLAAFDYRIGKEVWYVNLKENFEAEIPGFGYSESVLVDGDRLYCNPVGKKGFMVCLNKKDGKLIWTNREISGAARYSSPILGEFGGYRQIINMSSTCVYGVDTKTGKLLWNVEFKNRESVNCTDPIFNNGYVIVSSGYGKGSGLIKLSTSGEKIIPAIVWQTALMDNHHGGIILHEGYVYGSGMDSRGWFCLDVMTGKQMWKARGKGSLVFADNMLYCLEEQGTMRLVKATPEKYEEVSSFEVPKGGKGMHWAHPVVCGGRLYLRHKDNLFVYDIKGK